MNDYSVSEQTCTLQAFPCSFEYFFLLKNLPDIWDQMPYHMWHIYLITNRIYKELYHILYRPYSIWVDQVLAWQSKVSFSHIGTPLDYLIFPCFSYLCYLLRILLAASLFLSSLFIPSLLSSYLSLIVIFHIILSYLASLSRHPGSLLHIYPLSMLFFLNRVSITYPQLFNPPHYFHDIYLLQKLKKQNMFKNVFCFFLFDDLLFL